MRTLVKYIQNPQWHNQQAWRETVWQIMGNIGLTGLHTLPLHKSWVEFSRYAMPLQGLPPALAGLRIVQISDLHYSPVVWGKYLSQHIEWINEIAPALLVVTGDLFMGGRRYADKVARLLSGVKSQFGNICILGNHDYGIDGKAMTTRGARRTSYLVQTLRHHGIIVLRNQTWRFPLPHKSHSLAVVGLDDDWAGEMRPQEAFGEVHPNEPAICLVHNPVHCLHLLDYPWQWMLSGHTHGRQIAAGALGQRFYPHRFRQFTHGLYTVNGRHLYVNRGLSYGQRASEWCRPEITIFEMCPA